MNPPPAWWRPLHVRAALLALPLLVLLGGAMFALLQLQGAAAAREAHQRLNVGLARYIVEQLPASLIGADGRPDPLRMKALAGQVMAINPMVEVYLLDEAARVVAHALDAPAPDPVGAAVDMAPMQRLLRAAADERDVRLPVLGSDPRRPGRLATFTVAPIAGPGGKMGYLYIVLEGEQARRIQASLANSDALRAMAAGVVLATVLALALLSLAWRRLTRPLRRLTAEVQAFRVGDGAPHAAAAHEGDEIAVLGRAVAALQQRIAEQFRHLEDADRQRRELISNISHDLRTPLANIQGYVETVLLRAETLDPGQRAAHLRTALRHAELLGKRIADLFELAKLDAGRVVPRLEVFCLAELLQDVVQNYRLAAQQRGVELHLAAGSHTQARVRADIALIERVLQNLVDNALRHTAAGGRVELAIEDRGAFLQISVADDGCGIEHQHLPHIFERYWRAADADATAEHAAAGTSAGLGLAIVKRILDLHGSAVQVQSEPMRGTRFAFVLPQAG